MISWSDCPLKPFQLSHISSNSLWSRLPHPMCLSLDKVAVHACHKGLMEAGLFFTDCWWFTGDFIPTAQATPNPPIIILNNYIELWIIKLFSTEDRPLKRCKCTFWQTQLYQSHQGVFLIKLSHITFYKKRLVSRIKPSLLLKVILYNTWTLQLINCNQMKLYAKDN